MFKDLHDPFLRLSRLIRLVPALFSKRLFAFQTPFAERPILVRGRTSDVMAFFEVFIAQIYRIPRRDVTTILDIGANVGYASIYFAHAFPNACIIALEPERSNFQLLVRNTMNHPNIVCMQAAIWSHETELALQNPNAANWAFQYEQAHTNNPEDVVRSKTLPGLMAQFNMNRINILKVDIEGGERDLFAAGAPWLSLVDCLQIEIHTRAAKTTIFNALAGYSYSSSDAFHNYYIVLNHPKPSS